MVSSSYMSTDKAVIIAAGSGRRLQGLHRTRTPKPLAKVLGVPLLKRVILTAKQAGIREFHVVVGYEAEEIVVAIGSDRDLSDLDIRWVYNADWKKSNGVSVLKAAGSIDGPFVLLMSDHLFPVDSLKGLLAGGVAEGQAVLAIDRKIDELYDLDDGMKVQTEGNGIRAIAKNLPEFDSIDTGMFLCTPSLFDSLRSQFESRGDCSLADGIRELARQGRMRVYDIGGNWWQDVDTPGSLRHAQKLLLHSTAKPTDGVFSRYLNRPVSHVVSRWLSGTQITPNQVTFANFSLSLLAAYLVTYRTYLPFLMGAALFQLTSVLDGVDGEVAKLKFKQSRLGEWLDTITDNLSYVAFFVGVTIGAYRRDPGASVLLLGGASVVGAVLSLGLLYHFIRKHGRGTLLLLGMKMEKVVDDTSPLMRFLWHFRFAIKRDFFALLFLVIAAMGKPVGILWASAIGCNAVWMLYLLNRSELWREEPAGTRVQAEK